MTIRDPRSRQPGPSVDGPGDNARDPTQPLTLPPEESSHPSLAIGTSDVIEEQTKPESPGGRIRTTGQPPPIPRDEADVHVGSRLGTYRLLELIGKGGMGHVYRAEHVKLEREVALKLLRTDYARRRDAVLRFFQEAKTVNRVRHRNIVDVTDFVELEDGTTFIIMELLQGQSLGKWVRTGVDLPRALAVLAQICDGLGAAHAVGVIHRDLKPDNVIVIALPDGGELVKLLDFGVAKLVNRDDEDVGFQTAAGSVIGTPAYMSPEQAGGMAIDQRSDIYSLGAIMYELFCGQPMFRGRSFGEYVRKHLTEQPTPPRQTEGGASMDPRLEDVILRCLAKDPEERFGNILDLRDELFAMLGNADTSAPVPKIPTSKRLPLPAPPMTTTVTTQPSARQLALTPQSTARIEPASPTPWWVWFAGGAVAVGLGVIAAVWYANRKPEPVPPAPRPSQIAVAPIEPEPAPTAPAPAPTQQLVELRFDSLPGGGVYADGHATELCRTPCAFNVDLRDGGATDRRTFVVRSEGYKDKSVSVDLQKPPKEVVVTLQRLEQPILRPPEPVEDRTEHATKRPVAHAPARAHDKKPPEPEPEPAATKPEEPPPPPIKPPSPADDRIDPTDTHDPFHRHQ